MSFRPLFVVVTGLVSLVGLTACNSTPSHRRVLQDLIETLELPAEQEQCMLDKLATYSNQDLDNIVEENNNVSFTADGAVSGSESMQNWINDYRECVDGEAGATSEPTGTTEPTGSTDATGTEVTETTESSGTTEPTETTEAAGTTEAAATTDA